MNVDESLDPSASGLVLDLNDVGKDGGTIRFHIVFDFGRPVVVFAVQRFLSNCDCIGNQDGWGRWVDRLLRDMKICVQEELLKLTWRDERMTERKNLGKEFRKQNIVLVYSPNLVVLEGYVSRRVGKRNIVLLRSEPGYQDNPLENLHEFE